MNNGAFGENFPYTNFHDLNLDWIIKIFKEIKDKFDEGYVVSINGEQGEVELSSDWITALGINSVYHTTDNVLAYTTEQLNSLYENGYRVALQENSFGTNDLVYFLTNSNGVTTLNQYTPFSETSGVISVNGLSGTPIFGANNLPWNSSDLSGETIADKINGTNDIALWIGDSYVQANSLGDDQSQRFSTKVSTALHCLEKNYAIGGTGYIAPAGDTFVDQLDTAIEELTAQEKQNVKYVFIAGGRNDPWLVPDYTLQDLNTAFTQCVLKSKNNFPNAKIYFVPMLWDSTALTSTYKHYIFDIMRCTIFTGSTVRTVSNAYTYLTGRHDLILSDNVHPSVAGHAVIANRLLSSISGVNWNTPAFRETTNYGFTFKFSKVENTIQVTIDGTPTEALAFGTVILRDSDFGTNNQFAICTNGPAYMNLIGRDGTSCPVQIFFNRSQGKTLCQIQTIGAMTVQNYAGTVHITNGV